MLFPSFTDRVGIFFRRAHPGSTGAAQVEEVAGFLRTAYPSLPIRATTPFDGNPESLRDFVGDHRLRALVIADAGPAVPGPSLRESAEGAGLPPWAIQIVEFGDGSLPATDGDALREHFKAVCVAKVQRALAFREVPLDCLKPVPPRLDAVVSRRDLFRSLARVRYEVVPRVMAPRCKSRYGCALCLKACPLNAIAVANGQAGVDKARCDGCGFCVKACPAGAIEYPTFAPGQIDAEVQGLLHPASQLSPRIVTFVCRGTTVPLVPGVMPLPLACVGMVSPGLIVRAFDLGADGVALIQGGDGCGRCHEFSHLARELRAAQTMFYAFGIRRNRLALLPPPKDSRDLIGPLQQFVEAVSASGSHVFSEGEPVTPSADCSQLGWLLRGIGRRVHLSPVQGASSPLGILTVDRDRCTLCGLCAPPCPTEALQLRDTSGRVALAFDHAGCIACGLCLRACPEKALTLRRGLDPNRLQDTAILVEEEMARCRRCGAAFAPLRMCKKIQDLLAKSGTPRPDYVVNLCPTCRVAATLPSAPRESSRSELPQIRSESVLSLSP